MPKAKVHWNFIQLIIQTIVEKAFGIFKVLKITLIIVVFDKFKHHLILKRIQLKCLGIKAYISYVLVLIFNLHHRDPWQCLPLVLLVVPL
jgi:hypothetical protein